MLSCQVGIHQLCKEFTYIGLVRFSTSNDTKDGDEYKDVYIYNLNWLDTNSKCCIIANKVLGKHNYDLMVSH